MRAAPTAWLLLGLVACDAPAPEAIPPPATPPVVAEARPGPAAPSVIPPGPEGRAARRQAALDLLVGGGGAGLRAAIAIADQLGTQRYPQPLIDEMRGDSWHERANVLRYLGRHPEALDALDIAERAYAASHVAVYWTAIVEYSRAVIFLETGKLEDAVRLARNLCLSQFCLFSIAWELIAAPAPAGRSCILACDPRSSEILYQSNSGTTSSDQAERLVCMTIPSCSSFSPIAVSPVRLQVVIPIR